MSLLSRSKSADAATESALTKALAASQSNATAKSPAAPTAGATTLEQHLQLGDQALAEHGDNPTRLSDARHHFEEVLRASPAHGVAHHRLGVIADLQRDFAAAERHYSQALRVSPTDPQLLHDIGYSYLLQEKPAQAIPYLEQALTVAPTFDMAARKLADAQVRTRQFDQAAQTLSRVVPAEQVQGELAKLQAAHDPAIKPSLLGRVRDNMRDLRPESEPQQDPTQQLLAELQLARTEGERQRQQRAAQSAGGPGGYPGANPWNATPQQQRQQQELQYDSRLSSAMASIDRQYAPQPGQTYNIDATTGGMPQAGPQGQPQFAGAPVYGGQPAPGPSWPAIQPTAPSSTTVPVGYTAEVPRGAVSNSGDNSAGFQYAEVIRGVERGTAAPWEARHFAAQPGPASPQGGQPGGVLPAQALVVGSGGDGAGGVNSALYSAQSPNWAAPSFGRGGQFAGGPPQAANGAAVQSYEMGAGSASAPGTNWSATSPTDDYRAAAALGMGAGPGQMFPVIQQTAISSPGSGSLWNGAQFPQPGRQLPTDRSFADLAQAHRLPSQQVTDAPLTPAPNSLGQQMPSTGQYWTQPGQFAGAPQFSSPAGPQVPSGWGAGTTFESQPAQAAPVNPLQSYDQLRAQHDAQLNAAIQQVQGQYPSGAMATPSYGLPVDRPAPAASQMNGWYTQGANASEGRPLVTPEQYPSSNGYAPASAPPQVSPQAASSANISAALPPAQYAPNVVVPPAYGAARGQWTQPAISPAGGGNYGGPLIVPGN